MVVQVMDKKAKKVQVIFAHPDDVEFTSGGTIRPVGSSHVFIAGASGLG